MTYQEVLQEMLEFNSKNHDRHSAFPILLNLSRQIKDIQKTPFETLHLYREFGRLLEELGLLTTGLRQAWDYNTIINVQIELGLLSHRPY